VIIVMFMFKKMCLLSVRLLIEFKEFKDLNYYIWNTIFMIIIIINIFLHRLGHLTCSGIDMLSSFPAMSTISSSSGFVVVGVFRESVVIHSGNRPKENKILISRDAQHRISAYPYDY